ncbi:orotidine-5'-phosphate decarboxylase [Candidatus Providencia siddallii]|uniref:Orotidine 5'-phosphate decarboxylase n=1 Tax=Candidatus Providencia siddallii TaxID=1715285 RepID=A0ABM9NNQ7_9GAMM
MSNLKEKSLCFNQKIIVALDYKNINEALAFIDNINPKDCKLKVGQEIFTINGPSIVKILHDRGFDVFLDLKFHDISYTVSRAVAAAADMGVWMVNIHAIGGVRMMEAAKNALKNYSYDAPLLTAVTVLTNLNQLDFNRLGIYINLRKYTKHLALLSKACGLDGVICSTSEIQELRKACGVDFKLITPGIRILGDSSDDHENIMTPEDAIKKGSDYIVIGRSITRTNNQSFILKQINNSINKLYLSKSVSLNK